MESGERRAEGGGARSDGSPRNRRYGLLHLLWARWNSKHVVARRSLVSVPVSGNARADVVELVGGGDGVRSGVAVGLVVHKKME